MIGVSIVLYKTDPKELEKCLASFSSQKLITKIWIIDNYKYQPKIYQNITTDFEYSYSGSNLGYGKAHNEGIKKSIKNKLKYHIVLNSDTDLSALDINELKNVYEENGNFGILIPQVRDDNGNVSTVAKLLPTPSMMIARLLKIDHLFGRSYRRFNLSDYEKNKFVYAPYLSGCFMFFSTKKVAEVGLFDERFFMYPEDIDLSRRFYSKYVNVQYNLQHIKHSHRKESKKSIPMLLVHIKNMIMFFNKWGWIFDPQLKAINQNALTKNRKTN